MANKSKEPNFEFYVLNYNTNRKKVEEFNIFRNWCLFDAAVEDTKKYLDGTITYEDLKDKLRKDICWQEWSRREYEISVGDAFEEDCTKLEKWDCYGQALPNIEFITDMCIKRYKEWEESGSTGK